ncbi:PRC-barrel domain-containing protein [Desulfopila inferna]|uniref:PRC-barrel domain-containing protein n=1 Tax=Desulfopila inferna TaxID=468528 RepID=UPI0019658569|nr:PRC-barrel domain-containing protein [Desulfopila inferna]MBM9604931.1 PRC-barrel domain-containing protein [Desulfopila inferna]
MKKLSTILIALVATLALASPLYAAGDKSDKDPAQAGAMEGKSAKDLEGMKVVSQDGEEIGEIQSVTEDEQTGEIQFVTLSRGGVLGMGGEETPVPYEALQIDQEQATLTVDQSKLDNAPQQANMSDQEFRSELESHYGISPAWEQDTQMDQPQTTDPTMQPETESPGMEDPATSPDMQSTPGTSTDMQESPDTQQ